MAARKLLLLAAVGVVFAIANAEALLEYLRQTDAIETAGKITATCLTGSTIAVILSLVWLLPNKE